MPLIVLATSNLWNGTDVNLSMADTELKNFPLYCPKCKKESLIDVKDLQVAVIERLDVEMQG